MTVLLVADLAFESLDAIGGITAGSPAELGRRRADIAFGGIDAHVIRDFFFEVVDVDMGRNARAATAMARRRL